MRREEGWNARWDILDLDGRLLADGERLRTWPIRWRPSGSDYLALPQHGTSISIRRDGAAIAELTGEPGPSFIQKAAPLPGGRGWMLSVWDGTTRWWGPDGRERGTLPGSLGGIDPRSGRVLTWEGAADWWGGSPLRVSGPEGGEVFRLEARERIDWSHHAPLPSLGPGGDFVAVGWNDKLLVGSREGWREFPGKDDGAVLFSADGRTLLVCGSGVRLHEFTRGEPGPAIPLDSMTKDARAVSISPDGRRIATFGGDGVVRLWDTSGSLLLEIPAPSGASTPVSFHPSGELLLGVCGDGVVRVWNLDGGLVATVRERLDPIVDACFSSDGSRILTGTASGRGGSWLYRTQDLLDAVLLRTSRDFTDAEREKYPDLLK